MVIIGGETVIDNTIDGR